MYRNNPTLALSSPASLKHSATWPNTRQKLTWKKKNRDIEQRNQIETTVQCTMEALESFQRTLNDEIPFPSFESIQWKAGAGSNEFGSKGARYRKIHFSSKKIEIWGECGRPPNHQLLPVFAFTTRVRIVHAVIINKGKIKSATGGRKLARGRVWADSQPPVAQIYYFAWLDCMQEMMWFSGMSRMELAENVMNFWQFGGFLFVKDFAGTVQRSFIGKNLFRLRIRGKSFVVHFFFGWKKWFLWMFLWIFGCLIFILFFEFPKNRSR